MKSEPTEIRLHHRSRRAEQIADGTLLPRAAVQRNLNVIDAVFADLEATTLIDDKPAGQAHGVTFVLRHPLVLPHQGVIQQLAFQLCALDGQRQQLARLLHELQPPPPTNG